MSELQAATVFAQCGVGVIGWTIAVGTRDELGRGDVRALRTSSAGLFMLAAVTSVIVDWSVGARFAVIIAPLLLLRAVLADGPVRVSARLGDDDGTGSVGVTDLAALLAGTVAVAVAAFHGGGSEPLTLARHFTGVVLLGGFGTAAVVTHRFAARGERDRRAPEALVTGALVAVVVEVVAFLVPTGMGQVLSGTIDDGVTGILGWTWAMCAGTALGLGLLVRATIRDRDASLAAATFILYLAALCGFGTDLIARGLLAA